MKVTPPSGGYQRRFDADKPDGAGKLTVRGQQHCREARDTYVIGTTEEIVEQLLAQSAKIDQKTDAYMLTPISGDPKQLDLIRDRIAPKLKAARRRS